MSQIIQISQACQKERALHRSTDSSPVSVGVYANLLWTLITLVTQFRVWFFASPTAAPQNYHICSVVNSDAALPSGRYKAATDTL